MNRMLAAAVVGSVLAGAAVWVVRERSTGEPSRRSALDDETEARVREVWRPILAASKATSAERTALLEEARRLLLELETNHAGEPAVPFARGVIEVLGHREADAQAAYLRLLTATRQGAQSPMAAYLRAIHVLEFDRAHAAEAVGLLDALRSAAPGFMAEPVRRALYRALLLEHLNRIEREKFDDAVDLVTRAVEVAGSDVALSLEGRRARGHALAIADRWLDSERVWRELIVDSPATAPSSRFQLATALAAQNRVAEADVEYTAVIDSFPKGMAPADVAPAPREALLRRGNCRRLLGRYAEARADIVAYLALVPDDYRAEYWLGVVLIDGFQKADEAEPHLVRAHAAAPWCETYLRLLLTVYEDHLPDPEKARPLRAELEAKRADRAARRAELVKQGHLAGLVCD